ncbi:hypothetical protein ACLOJK_012336 [Asimina triloba]
MLIRLQRERSERNKQAEVDALVGSGGSIRDRYALLWHQQMERRRQLVQLGASAGVYKTLVKYLVGVPETGGEITWLTSSTGLGLLRVLLDFIRQINDDHGQKDELALLKQAVDVEVFANAPFFISAVEAGPGESSKKDDYKETVVPAGKTHEDIGFSVEYISPSGQTMMILPYRRSEADQGNFSTLMAGCYKLIWDNSYSTFLKKVSYWSSEEQVPISLIDIFSWLVPNMNTVSSFPYQELLTI